MDKQLVELPFNNGLLQISVDLGSSIGTTKLIINVINQNNELHTKEIEVESTPYLYTSSEPRGAATVLLEKENLFISGGGALFSFSVPELNQKWMFQPDQFGLFEFYELEDDLLIRSELSIYRIDKAGKLIWTFSGKDIFLNINGKEEVKIFDDFILLTDFEDDEYRLTYSGKTIQ
jgi:hypothetical protein